MDLPEFSNGFVAPEWEIDDISHGLEKFNNVVLTGMPGIGKTTLAKYYQALNPLGFKEITFFYGVHFDYDYSFFSLLKLQSAQSGSQLIIIDGYDEIYNPKTKEGIIKLVKEGKKYGLRLLITSRHAIIDEEILENSYNIKVGRWTDGQILRFLENNVQKNILNDDIIEQLIRISKNLSYTPLMLSTIVALLSTPGITSQNVVALLSNNIYYNNQSIQLPAKGGLLTPEIPKIITDISIINSSLIDKVKSDPQFMYSMTTRQFEELVGELFTKEGYNVTITQATVDGGKDLLIIEQKRIGNFVIYVECKRKEISNPVGVRLVRELYGTVMADRATAGILVTSSYFSRPAEAFKEQVKSQLSLIDYYNLKKWIDEKANSKD